MFIRKDLPMSLEKTGIETTEYKDTEKFNAKQMIKTDTLEQRVSLERKLEKTRQERIEETNSQPQIVESEHLGFDNEA
jgi:hypothetical protein